MTGGPQITAGAGFGFYGMPLMPCAGACAPIALLRSDACPEEASPCVAIDQASSLERDVVVHVAVAATARRGAELLGLPEPKSPESSEPKLPPPPPPRPSSMVRVELKPCSTTSVE